MKEYDQLKQQEKNVNYVKISKYMSMLLRHRPEVIGITLDEHGWKTSGMSDICETALYIHGLTDREYGRIEVTVPQGYNAVHLRKKKIQVRSLKEDLYELGETVVESGYGNQIVAYDKERAICDAVINRKS